MKAKVANSMKRLHSIACIFGTNTTNHRVLIALACTITFLCFHASALWATDHSGSITSDTTWYAADNPHVIIGHVTVQAGVTLTLEDGVEVQFDVNKRTDVYGTLTSVGTPGTGIVFTRSGASNGGGLRFYSGGSGALDYCTVEYVNNGIHTHTSLTDTVSVSNSTLQNNGSGVYAQGGTVELTSTTITNNTSYGFLGYGVAPTLLDVNTVFENNPTGIYVSDVSGLSLTTATTIRNNTSVGIELDNCTGHPTLDNLTLQGNVGTYGAIYVRNSGEFTVGSGNTIGGSGQENSWPVTMNIGSYPSLASDGNIPAGGNTHDAIQVYAGSTSDSVVWYDLGLDYVVTSTPTILAGGTVSINDSLTVKFDHGRRITVDGTLNAIGTGSILFTRYEPDDQWQGLRFRSGSSGTLQHCTIEHATYTTSYGIYGNGAFPTIENCTIRNNDYGIYVQNVTSPVLSTANTIQDNSVVGVSFYQCTSPSISNQTITGHNTTYGAIFMDNTGEFTIGTGNTIGGGGQENSWPVTINIGSYPSLASDGNIPTSGNINNDIQVYAGSTSDSVAWHDVGLDYVVTSTPTIQASGTLNIADSLIVKFDHGKNLTVNGILNATGIGSILFTRYEPDDQWNGLRFHGGSSGTLQNCTIEYVTYSTGYGIFGNGAFPTIENCIIRYNDYGIYAQNATSPTLSVANTIQDNAVAGISFYQCTNPIVSNQTITGHNTTHGAIFMNNTGEFTIGSGNTIGGGGQENSWPVTINIGSYPSPASDGNIPDSGNTHNDIQVYGGSTSDSVVWHKVGADYIVTANPTIQASGVLNIDDSLTVKFVDGKLLTVNGTLNALGTGSILFTRYEPDDQWNGLRFHSGSNGTLRHCTIEHATYSNSYGIYGNGAFPSIENCIIRNNNYGIYALNATSPTLSVANTIQDNSITGISFYQCTSPSISNQTITGHNTTHGAIFMDNTGEFTIGSGNTIGGGGQENSWPVTMDIGSYPSLACDGNIPASGNTHNDIQVYGGPTSDSVAWRDVGADYIVTSSPTISANGTLNIDDSVTVKFEHAQHLIVDGTLNTTGTGSILFTRYELDDLWNGLIFRTGSGGTLQGCIIEHATYGTGHGIRTYAGADTISISDCTIQNNNYGFYAIGGVLSFRNNRIIDNADYGIYLNGAIPASFGSNLSEWNDIYGNGAGSDGRDLHNGTLDTYAPYVYWGTVDRLEIEAKIWDAVDDTALGAVCYGPWSTASHDFSILTGLTIALESGSKSSSGNMRLVWPEFCGEGGVDHYVVYRSTTAYTRGDSLAGTTDNEYLDVGVAGDVNTNYYYIVEIVDGVGNRFDTSQVGEFDRNMIAVP